MEKPYSQNDFCVPKGLATYITTYYKSPNVIICDKKQSTATFYLAQLDKDFIIGSDQMHLKSWHAAREIRQQSCRDKSNT